MRGRLLIKTLRQLTYSHHLIERVGAARMTEDNGKAIQKWSGGTVLFAGGTDWSSIGRNIIGKKKGGADAVRNFFDKNL